MLHHRASLYCICFLALLLIPGQLMAWEGRVVGITDGDTIRVLHEHQEIKIRLWCIDCPESHQDFGNRAKQMTSKLAFGKNLRISEIDKDRYGRTVAIVTLPDGQVLNEALISAGMAWVYRRYCDKQVCPRWLELEASARGQRIGLWSHPNPVPPWEYRRK